jgi:hypothetical protein
LAGLGENVTDDLAAYGINQADGWGTDLVTGQPTFTRHDFAARSKLLWISTDGTRILMLPLDIISQVQGRAGRAMTCGADVERGILRKPTYRRFMVLWR